MEAQRQQVDLAALHAQREARKAQQKAVKMERFLKKPLHPQAASGSGSQWQEQSQKKVSEGSKRSQPSKHRNKETGCPRITRMAAPQFSITGKPFGRLIQDCLGYPHLRRNQRKS